jgi:Tfp pilus assembly protein PilX
VQEVGCTAEPDYPTRDRSGLIISIVLISVVFVAWVAVAIFRSVVKSSISRAQRSELEERWAKNASVARTCKC